MQVVILNDRLTYSLTINDDYIEQIRILKSDLVDEKKRVLTLAGLCEPIKNLSTVLDTYGQVQTPTFIVFLFSDFCCIYV